MDKVKLGLGLALVGLGISCLSLLPAFRAQQFPWPFVIGAVLYIPGGLMVALSARGPERNKHMLMLRALRLGFFVVLIAYLVGQYGWPR